MSKLNGKYSIGDYVCFISSQKGVWDNHLLKVIGSNMRGRNIMQQLNGQKRLSDDCFLRYANTQEINVGYRVA